MNDTQQVRRIAISVYVTPEIHKKILLSAMRNQRSVSGEIRMALISHYGTEVSAEEQDERSGSSE